MTLFVMMIFVGGYSAVCAEAESQTEPVSDSPQPDKTTPAEAKTKNANSDGNELMMFTDIPEIEITSASKKEQKLHDTAAAVYVVTTEDIRRIGATNIMEALRIVPGLFVGQISPNDWAISTRGFVRQYATKLLVLVDGRSIYTPLFGGVFWDLQDIPLSNIERIEVIRGPGGTLWGANAVNGVINIITKKARDTQGGIVTGGVGSLVNGMGFAQYGGKIGEKTHYRVFSKYYQLDNFIPDRDMNPASVGNGGFRVDSDVTPNDTLSSMGEWKEGKEYFGAMTYQYSPPYTQRHEDSIDLSNHYILERWDHKFDDSDMTLQVYYDQSEHWGWGGGEYRDTFDVDFQHRFKPVDRHELVWGLGYRNTVGHFRHGHQDAYVPMFDIDPARRSDSIYSSFVQDEITLVEDRLRLILGSKFEHNDYTGFEWQPSGRLVYTPNSKNAIWGAISRAVSVPSWAMTHFEVNNVFDTGQGMGGRLVGRGNPELESETVIAYEIGYRREVAKNLSFDLASFYNVYNHQITMVPEPTGVVAEPEPHVEIPYIAENVMHSRTWGVEASANWDVMENWRLSGGYTFTEIQLHNAVEMFRPIFDSEGSTPTNQFNVRSYINLPHNLEFDTMLYYVDNLSEEQVPSYVRLDVRMGWKPTPNLEISLLLANLLDHDHREFGSMAIEGAEIPRSLYGQVTWRF